MSRLALRKTRTTVYYWLLAQVCVVIVVSLLSYFIQGVASVLATLLGGFICVVPQAIFARALFAFYKANSARQIVQVFLLGEFFKLLFTGLLFLGILIKLPSVRVPELFLGFISAQVAFWLSPYLVKLFR